MSPGRLVVISLHRNKSLVLPAAEDLQRRKRCTGLKVHYSSVQIRGTPGCSGVAPISEWPIRSNVCRVAFQKWPFPPNSSNGTWSVLVLRSYSR